MGNEEREVIVFRTGVFGTWREKFSGRNGDVAFRKAFKDRFGLSPLQWRATNH